jgi:hypothetical protein
MSEEATPSPGLGSAAGSPPVEGDPSPAPQPGSSGEPAASEPTGFTRENLLGLIPEDIRGEAVFQNINEENPIEDLSRQFLHAQKLVGLEKMPAPREDWTQEQWGSLWDRLGRPETVDGYTVPETSLQLDENAVGQFRELAHKIGLSKGQFEQLSEFHNNLYGGMAEQMTAQQSAQIEQGLLNLRQEWGDGFDENLQMADRYFTKLNDEGLKELVMGNEMLRNHPSVIKLFHSLALDSQEAAVRVGDSTNPAVIRSTEQAQAALRKYEEDHRDVLFKHRESLSPAEQARLADVVERRAELYKLAFPE